MFGKQHGRGLRKYEGGDGGCYGYGIHELTDAMGPCIGSCQQEPPAFQQAAFSGVQKVGRPESDRGMCVGWEAFGGEINRGRICQDKLYTCMKLSNSKNILCKINICISSAYKFTFSKW